MQTTDGRVVTGLIADQDAGSVTLLTAKNERVRLARGEIASLDESPQSLMPENIVEQLSPQELRDLFAWLQQPADSEAGEVQPRATCKSAARLIDTDESA